jgi:hypothetical protein
MADNSHIPSHRGTPRATRTDATVERGPWSSLYSRPLTAEDGREIALNLAGFFSIVSQWEAAAHRGPLGLEQFRGGGTPNLGGAALGGLRLGRTA